MTPERRALLSALDTAEVQAEEIKALHAALTRRMEEISSLRHRLAQYERLAQQDCEEKPENPCEDGIGGACPMEPRTHSEPTNHPRNGTFDEDRPRSYVHPWEGVR